MAGKLRKTRGRHVTAVARPRSGVFLGPVEFEPVRFENTEPVVLVPSESDAIFSEIDAFLGAHFCRRSFLRLFRSSRPHRSNRIKSLPVSKLVRTPA